MLCPKCNTELRITKSAYKTEIDGTEVKLFIVQDLSCTNKQCENNGKIVEQVSTEIPHD